MTDHWQAEVSRRQSRLLTLANMEPDEKQATIEGEITLCAQDPIYWMSEYAWVFAPQEEDPTKRMMPFVPWSKQVELIWWLLEKRARGETGLVAKGREIGATWVCMLLSFHLFTFEKGFTVKLGSRKQELVDDRTADSLFGKLRLLREMQPHFLQQRILDTFKRFLHPPTGAEIVGEATNAGFGRGGRKNLLVLDEFAFVEPRLQQEIWVSRSTLARSTWVPSTPNGRGNKFHALYETLAQDQIFEMDWTANPDRDLEWFDGLLVENGGELTEDERAQEHEISFDAAKTGRIFTVQESLTRFDEQTPEWVDVQQEARAAWDVLGGWDFGIGVSRLVCLMGLVQRSFQDGRHILWITEDPSWLHTDWQRATADIRELMGQYGGRAVHWGDPAGKQKDSSLASWETNLRRGGVPYFSLPDFCNTSARGGDGIEWTIKHTQLLISDGRIRIHRRCEYLWACVKGWTRDVPPGVDISFISKAYIAPRKDDLSHGGDALRYLGAAFLMNYKKRPADTQEEETEADARLPKSLSHGLARMAR